MELSVFVKIQVCSFNFSVKGLHYMYFLVSELCNFFQIIFFQNTFGLLLLRIHALQIFQLLYFITSSASTHFKVGILFYLLVCSIIWKQLGNLSWQIWQRFSFIPHVTLQESKLKCLFVVEIFLLMRSFVLLYVDRVEVPAYKNKNSDSSILYKLYNEICIKIDLF